MWQRLVLLVALLRAGLAAAGALELTEENYDEATKGKYVFLMLYAPWCGHCKKLKPTWSMLAAAYKGSKHTLIAQADCTSAGGLPLCIREDVKAYPTLKWGDPADLQLYEYARTSEAFSDFMPFLNPSCSVSFLHLCPHKKRREVLVYQVAKADELKKAFMEQYEEEAKGEIAECGKGDDGEPRDAAECEKVLKEERERYENMPAERLKATFINQILWSDDDEEPKKPGPKTGASEEASKEASEEAGKAPEAPDAPEETKEAEEAEEAEETEETEETEPPSPEAPRAVGHGEL